MKKGNLKEHAIHSIKEGKKWKKVWHYIMGVRAIDFQKIRESRSVHTVQLKSPMNEVDYYWNRANMTPIVTVAPIKRHDWKLFSPHLDITDMTVKEPSGKTANFIKPMIYKKNKLLKPIQDLFNKEFDLKEYLYIYVATFLFMAASVITAMFLLKL